MRTRKRAAVVLASAAALGVSLFAFTASAAAAPPVVPTCTPKASTGSDSCVVGRYTASDGSVGTALEAARLGVRVRSVFSPANHETSSVTLRFDDDAALNLTGIPTCPAASVVGKNIAAAWAACGPGGGATKNAFLSTGLGANVSGIGSTVPPGNFIACTMIFKGADNNHLTIYARAPVSSATTGCNNPATNTAGTTTVVFTGTLTHEAATSPYDVRLTVPNTQAANPALDDFYATVKRTTAFRAKCVSPMRMLGFWDYTATGDANDTKLATDPCPP
jgi:hypothetical protein